MLKPNKPIIIIFLGPAILFYLLVFLYPTLRTIAMSFFAVESVSASISEWTFNGIENYKRIFSTQIFIQSLQNIGRIWFFGGILVMFFALVFAVILTGKLKGTRFFRSAIYLPNVISAVAMGAMWLYYVYNNDYGFLSSVLRTLGFHEASNTLWTGPGLRFWAMFAAYCFGMVGYHMLIFISGIEQIPSDYYEAALIEGAGVIRRFFLVTLPNIRGVARTNIVMWTVFTVGFFVWAQIFSPLNLSFDTVAPMNFMYQLVFGAMSSAVTVRDSGAGAAIGVILMMSVVFVFFATNLIVRNDDAEL